jgi:chaperonin cofactor prefoldin
MNEQLDIEIAILKKNVADQQEEIHNLQMRLKKAIEDKEEAQETCGYWERQYDVFPRDYE